MSARKPCVQCGVEKALSDFYPAPSTKDGRHARCKKCDNARPRKVTAAKINRMRARHRAMGDLIRFHEDEFEALLAIRLAEAQEEAEALAADPRAAEHYAGNEPVRLKPGKPMPGEKAGDRIDVARCPHCVKHHDRGHICGNCGAAPIAVTTLPDDDGEVDEIAVERAMKGDLVKVTQPERIEALRRLTAGGTSDAEIARRLHVTTRNIQRWRREHAIKSGWTA